MDEIEHDSENYQAQSLRYLPKPKSEADNTNQGLNNSHYHAKTEFNNCFIIPLHNNTIILLYNYTIIQLYNYTIIQLYNHTIIQLYNYTITQLHNYTIINVKAFRKFHTQ